MLKHSHQEGAIQNKTKIIKDERILGPGVTVSQKAARKSLGTRFQRHPADQSVPQETTSRRRDRWDALERSPDQQATCITGSSILTLEGGVKIAVRDLKIGDRIVNEEATNGGGDDDGGGGGGGGGGGDGDGGGGTRGVVVRALRKAPAPSSSCSERVVYRVADGFWTTGNHPIRLPGRPWALARDLGLLSKSTDEPVFDVSVQRHAKYRTAGPPSSWSAS